MSQFAPVPWIIINGTLGWDDKLLRHLTCDEWVFYAVGSQVGPVEDT